MTWQGRAGALPALLHALLPSLTLQAYNERQVKQLTRLIEVTRTNLTKADRQKVGVPLPNPQRAAGRASTARRHDQGGWPLLSSPPWRACHNWRHNIPAHVLARMPAPPHTPHPTHNLTCPPTYSHHHHHPCR